MLDTRPSFTFTESERTRGQSDSNEQEEKIVQTPPNTPRDNISKSSTVIVGSEASSNNKENLKDGPGQSGSKISPSLSPATKLFYSLVDRTNLPVSQDVSQIQANSDTIPKNVQTNVSTTSSQAKSSSSHNPTKCKLRR